MKQDLENNGKKFKYLNEYWKQHDIHIMVHELLQNIQLIYIDRGTSFNQYFCPQSI